MSGTIKNVNQEKMYGFIIGDNGVEYFFHRECLINSPDWEECEKGRAVTFKPTDNPKGKRAEDVMVL